MRDTLSAARKKRKKKHRKKRRCRICRKEFTVHRMAVPPVRFPSVCYRPGCLSSARDSWAVRDATKRLMGPLEQPTFAGAILGGTISSNGGTPVLCETPEEFIRVFGES